MADREIIGWFTVNGQHRPIYEGESKEDAYRRAVAKSNEDTKQRQIAKNKEQADKLNGKSTEKSGGEKPTSELPRRLDLKNIKAEDANKTSDILHLRTRQRFTFKNGTEIRNVYVFAGKGCSKEFRDAEKYAKRWGGKAVDWQHCAGKAVITNGTKDFVREVHWVQGADGKMREAFIKEYPKNLKDTKPDKGGRK